MKGRRCSAKFNMFQILHQNWGGCERSGRCVAGRTGNLDRLSVADIAIAIPDACDVFSPRC